MKKIINKLDSHDHWFYLPMFFVVIGIVLLYTYNLNHEFTYDDTVMIIRPEIPGSVSDVLKIFKEQYYPELPYYRPIIKSSFLIQKAIHGENPAPFRIFDAFIIGLASYFMFAMLRLSCFKTSTLMATFAAALFGLHPVVASSVYPAWGRDSLLWGFFVIVSVFFFLKKGKKSYGLSVLFCLLALLSKEASVVLIGIFVIADVLKLSADAPGKDFRKWFHRYWMIALIYILYFAIRFHLFSGREYEWTVIKQPFLPLLTPVYAFQVIIAPFRDLVYEPRSWKIWLSLPRMILTGIVFIILAIAVIKRWHVLRARTLFWIGWFVLCNLPTSNILKQESLYAERFLFPSILAIIGIVVAVIETYQNKIRLNSVTIILTSIFILLCAGFTIHRNHYYDNNLVFYKQWLKYNPDYYLPNHAMGTILFEKGRKDEAAVYYKKAISMNPVWPDSHLNLGIIYLENGALEDAFHCFSEYVRLNPNSAKAYYSMGVILTKQNRFDEAITYYSRALQINPVYAEAHHNMGIIYYANEDLGLALKHFKEALKIKPGKKNTQKYLRMINSQ